MFVYPVRRHRLLYLSFLLIIFCKQPRNGGKTVPFDHLMGLFNPASAYFNLNVNPPFLAKISFSS